MEVINRADLLSEFADKPLIVFGVLNGEPILVYGAALCTAIKVSGIGRMAKVIWVPCENEFEFEELKELTDQVLEPDDGSLN